MATAIDRLPPQNVEAERSLIGSLLIDPDAIMKIGGQVGPDDFYREQHRAIYEAVAGLAARNEKADYVTVCDELTRLGHLDTAGGETYIAEIVNAVPTAFHVDHYAAIVRRASILRRIIQGASQMVTAAYRPEAEPNQVLDAAEQLIFSIASESHLHDFETIHEILHQFADQLMFRQENRGVTTGVASGIKQLDTLTGGFQRQDLVILAARPGVGKTAFALHIALHAASQNDVPVGFFSLEMPNQQIAQRIVGHEARVDSIRLRDGRLDDKQLRRVVHTMDEVAKLPVYVDDSPTLTILELRGKARRMQIEHNLGLLVVDYLQLLSTSTHRENRVQEITEITRSLKALARELDIPLVACAQLSRAAERRDDARPRLSDLRESGSIEQDADLVMFLHQPDRNDDDTFGRPVDLQLTIAKHRNGPVGQLDLKFRQAHGRFDGVPAGAA